MTANGRQFLRKKGRMSLDKVEGIRTDKYDHFGYEIPMYSELMKFGSPGIFMSGGVPHTQ